MSKRLGSKIQSRSTKYRHALLRKANRQSALDYAADSSEDDNSEDDDFSLCEAPFEEQFKEVILPNYDYQPTNEEAEPSTPINPTNEEAEPSTPINPTNEEAEPSTPINPTNEKAELATPINPSNEKAELATPINEGSPEALQNLEVFNEDEEWTEDADFEHFETPVGLPDSDNSSGEDDNDDEQPQVADRPLFVNSTLSLADSILSLITLAFTFKLSGECLNAILNLIVLHCPKPNICLKSLYLLKKFFAGMNAPLNLHYYCSNCNGILVDKDSLCANCPAISFKLGHFIEMSVAHQLQSLFKRESFYSDLQYRFHRKKYNEHGIEDIFDGDIYKKHFENNGFLSHPNNISFMWYTDGVPLYKSSKFSIWPLYYAINELPYTKRTLTENMIVAGLWFGPSKPDGNTFLRPLYNGLQTLYNGIQVCIPGSAANITVRSRLLCGTCDLPAKCMMFNTVQFNGAYGCPRCLQRGERYTLGPRSGVHVYPFQETIDLRTHDETLNHSEEAVASGMPVYGVKGPSMLARLVPDMIRSTAVDVMHSLYLGVTKRLLHLWFDASFSKFPFSLSLMLNVIDSRLSSVKPPNFVPRTPRSIKEHLCYWKASELKTWFFYYSIPVLYGIMQTEYLEHHIHLVLAMFILNQRSISQAQLDFCTTLIKSYVGEFQVLYGVRFMSANIHQLLHYVDTVRDLGPLWVSSCLPFEDLNGKITRLVHGTRYAQLQICSSISYIQNLPHLIHKLHEESEVRMFYNKLKTRKSLKINEEISENVFSVGSYRHLLPVPLTIAEALYNADIMVGTGNCQMFYRLKKKHILYCSKSYTNIKKTVSFCVLYGQHREVALIQCFARWSNCKCNCLCKCEAQYFAILSLYECTDIAENCNAQGYDVFFLKKMCPRHEVLAVPIQDLIALCFCIEVNNEFHWALPVNDIEEE